MADESKISSPLSNLELTNKRQRRSARREAKLQVRQQQIKQRQIKRWLTWSLAVVTLAVASYGIYLLGTSNREILDGGVLSDTDRVSQRDRHTQLFS